MLTGAVEFPPVVIHVSPHKLEQHTLEPNLKWVVWSARNLPQSFCRVVVFRLKYLLGRNGVFRGDWDRRSKPFSERDEYHLISDLHRNLPDYRKSEWYRQGLETLGQGGTFAHKTEKARSIAELDGIFSGTLVPLLETMQREGYRQREGADLPEGMIGRDGALIKTAHGTHRLAAAKSTGAPGLYPIKVVGVHRQWLSGLEQRKGETRDEMLDRELKQIEALYR